MLSTTLPLHTVRTNAGTTAVIATVGTSEVLIGESTSIGGKRAIIDVMNGSGSHLAKTLARLEKRQEALDNAFNAKVERELGFDTI